MDFLFIKTFIAAISLIMMNVFIMYSIFRNEVDKAEGWTAAVVIYFLLFCLLLSV